MSRIIIMFLRALLPTLLLGVALPTGSAQSEVTFEYICEGTAFDISADGTVVVGTANSDQLYDTFRWTSHTGAVMLGQNPYVVFGTSAGTPGISADGTQISATILGADSTYITQGVWTEGQGWQETMPPAPPDGGIMDNAYGSAWDLSGDGTTLVGLYWRPGQQDGSAHASAWTAATGTIDLGSTGDSSRANSLNHDGSVVVGWDRNPNSSSVRPAVWRNGGLTILCANDEWGAGEAVTPDGMIVVGFQRNEATSTRTAAMWRWDGAGWGPTEYLGVLPGTVPDAGIVKAEAVSADGSVVVGYCSYAGDPFYATGFLWTEATGIIDIEDFLIDNGIPLDPDFDIKSLHGVSADGTVILGVGDRLVPPYGRRSFLIRRDTPAATPDGAAETSIHVQLRAWPNPILSGGTTLSLEIPGNARGSLKIYDAAGRLVRSLLSGSIDAGRHLVTWDGRDEEGAPVASGVYYSLFEANTARKTGKIIVMR